MVKKTTNMILVLFSLLRCTLAIDGLEGVKESKVDDIFYKSEVYNDHIDLINVVVKPDKLVMRSSIDEGAMMRWDVPNKADDWAFEVDFNEPNLNATEFARLYIFYTKEKPLLGGFKGGNTKFNGFAAGVEFQGKRVELGYALNKGEDFFNMDDFVTRMDSLNPRRFQELKSLKLKVICTSKNFKMEVYSGETVIYDNFRFFSADDLENRKKGHYIGIFADYKNVSSGKAFEITRAQLYRREETSNYKLTKSYMDPIIGIIRDKEQILHPNEDIKTFIFKVHKLAESAKIILGELPESSIKNSEIEILKEIESLNDQIKRLKEIGRMKSTRSSSEGIHSNDIDNKVKRLYKNITDFEFSIESIAESNSRKYNMLEILSMVLGVFAMSFMIYRETIEYMQSRKENNK